MNFISLPLLIAEPKYVPWSPFLPAEARCPMGRVWQRAYRRHHYQRWEEWHWHSPGKIHLHQPQKQPLVLSPGFGAKRRWAGRNPLSLGDWFFFLREVLGEWFSRKPPKLIPALQVSISKARESRNNHFPDWCCFPDTIRKKLLQLSGTVGPKISILV